MKQLSSNIQSIRLELFILIKYLVNTIKNFSRITWIKVLLFFATISVLIILFFYFKTQIGWPDALIITIVLIFINLPVLLHWLIPGKIKSSLLSVYLTLMILNFSIFPLYDIFKEFKNKKVKYTIGFRAWASEVEISEIKIIYFDEYNKPDSIKEEEIYDENNWKGTLWTYHNLDKNITSDVNKLKKNIRLRSCGIAFNPEIFNNKKVRNFEVKATFKLINIDTIFVKNFLQGAARKYYSSQICLMIPVYNDDYSWDNYLGYEFFYYNFSWSKLRIPGLNYDFMSETLYKREVNKDSVAINDIKYIKDSILNIHDRKIEKDSIVRLSAINFNNQCCFKIFKKGETASNSLFDFFISEDKLFSLSLKK